MSSNTIAQEQGGKPGRRWVWVTFFWYMALLASVSAVERIFRYYELSAWLKVVVALLPVLPFVVLARLHWQAMTKGDEMARHIARETYVFAFYALVAVFIATDLLKAGGLLGEFAWKTKWLIYAMIGTLAAANGWVSWRYR